MDKLFLGFFSALLCVFATLRETFFPAAPSTEATISRSPALDNSAPRIFLIDTYGFIFRAFHARARMQAPPMRTSAGLPTEAVLIFHNMLRKLAKSFAPRYM